jgi:YggT family protein
MQHFSALSCPTLKTKMLRAPTQTCSGVRSGWAYGISNIRVLPSLRVPRALKSTPEHNGEATTKSSSPNLVGLVSVVSSALLLAASSADATGLVSGTSSSMVMDAAGLVAAASKAESILKPTFAIYTLLYVVRIPMTWYPDIDGSKLPWAIAYLPTEPFLKATKNFIPLIGGVDVNPIVWLSIVTFLNEILLGPQGLLILIQRQNGSVTLG